MKNNYTERIESGLVLNTNPTYDISRTHAVNWGIGVALVTFCVYTIGWTLLIFTWDGLKIWTIVLCIPVSIVAGLGMGGKKLMEFTQEHRYWTYWYHDQEEKALDFQEPVGDLPLEDYTMLRGVDGQFHRINTQLSYEEKNQLKRYLIGNETVTVRGLDPIVGNRATQLRVELMTLGICGRPAASNQGAEITPIGKKTIMRW